MLSEREKDELVQLVDTMVSYSVTYRNTKFVPQEKANLSVVPHEVSSLSLYPPINDVINFEVCLIFQSSYQFNLCALLTVPNIAVDIRAINQSTLDCL